ncbi:ubiquitin-conjugating enzyme/RWD-like protein [Lentinula detonsa]|uniref:Ubiquitin-conjugating enzyme/RWD-like protein n=1 Tax=Lentinula detonsa TaxID=2804962 RepID=A0A9W8TSJ8_9AGAR|nr:ubiquitin-conjugating enzyme/RWD-like protein [Lentinula detonsa]
MPPGTAASPMTMTTKRIHREVADLKKEDLGAMTLAPSDDNLFLWKGQIPGPSGSVYEGGMFDLDVTLALSRVGLSVFTAPRVTFKTRIYHMNILEHGDICIDILKHNWSPALSLFKVLLSLSLLLTDPNPCTFARSPDVFFLVGAIANQYTSNRQMHDSIARQWTKLYAMPKPPPPPPAASYSKAMTTPAASTRARGKATASSSATSTNTNPSSSSSTSRTKAGAKRKQRSGASGHTNGESLDDDGEIEFNVDEGRRRKWSTRATPAERGRHVHDSDIIVIDND